MAYGTHSTLAISDSGDGTALGGLQPIDTIDLSAPASPSTADDDASGDSWHSIFDDLASPDLLGSDAPATTDEPANDSGKLAAGGEGIWIGDGIGDGGDDIIVIDDPVVDWDPDNYSDFWSEDAGDVNGDGIADHLVNVYGAKDGVYSSATYVLFGTADGADATGDISEIADGKGFQLISVRGVDEFWAMAAGDLNGDGRADLLVDVSRGDGSQEFHVVYGTDGPTDAEVDVSTAGTTLAVSGLGEADIWWADPAGDVNGDGLADLQIDVVQVDADGNDSGASYIVYGKAGGFTGAIDVTHLDPADGYLIPDTAWNADGTDSGDGGGVADDGGSEVMVPICVMLPVTTDSIL